MQETEKNPTLFFPYVHLRPNLLYGQFGSSYLLFFNNISLTKAGAKRFNSTDKRTLIRQRVCVLSEASRFSTCLSVTSFINAHMHAGYIQTYHRTKRHSNVWGKPIDSTTTMGARNPMYSIHTCIHMCIHLMFLQHFISVYLRVFLYYSRAPNFVPLILPTFLCCRLPEKHSQLFRF